MEILNEIQGEAITHIPGLFFFFATLLAIAMVLLLVELSDYHGSASLAGVYAILAILFLLAMIAVPTGKTGEYEPTRYEAVITDEDYVIDASKYKIIEKRGEIYLLEEVEEVLESE